jgi:hypothetical protein
MEKVALGHVLSDYFGFPLSIIPPTAPHSSSIIRGRYNRPVVANATSGFSLTPHTKKTRNKSSFLILERLWQRGLRREPNIWADKSIWYHGKASSEVYNFRNRVQWSKVKNRSWNIHYIQLKCSYVAFSCSESKYVFKVAFVPATLVYSE